MNFDRVEPWLDAIDHCMTARRLTSTHVHHRSQMPRSVSDVSRMREAAGKPALFLHRRVFDDYLLSTDGIAHAVNAKDSGRERCSQL